MAWRRQQGNQSYASGTDPNVHNSGGGLNKVTYGKQPSWAHAEQHKNVSGQYRPGMFSQDRARKEAGPPRAGGYNRPSGGGYKKPSAGTGGGAKFCSGCGAKASGRFCSGCGKQL
eukprot:TRINITY_DN5723_c0_g1_i2.p1 TRINITY_DN5723_c0_g1~~TRINITY_DN5723_c0_g1_i2.p1  ORF type:complete len:115 (-),score=13.34 TRINITY_DN5723_c0_g1_i2:50-394(-)